MDRSPSHTIHSPQLWSFAPQGSNLRPGDKYPGLANLVPLSRFKHEGTGSHRTPRAKRARARVVPGWVTSREVLPLGGTRFAKLWVLIPVSQFEPQGRKTTLGPWMVWEGLRSMAHTACAVLEGVRPMAGPLHYSRLFNFEGEILLVGKNCNDPN
ncbi:hypothetical protein Sjap_020114 [Stephania japonica]|uniref:Uncharacterized protein n=1 Tax=Stephania japonica TaxID=461633 RepID=A0AAP0F2T0_9MAGN